MDTFSDKESLAVHDGPIDLPDSLSARLDDLPAGTRVALLVMLGSVCPITVGHVAMFTEARAFLKNNAQGPDVVRTWPRSASLEVFAEVLGLLYPNDGYFVTRKLKRTGEQALQLRYREQLTRAAVAEHDWLFSPGDDGFIDAAGQHYDTLKERWPLLQFVVMDLNGADDVARYCKWNDCRYRAQFVMGRPGHTDTVIAGAIAAGVDLDGGTFIVGPQLEADVSSTTVRRLLRERAYGAVGELLHPVVLEWHRRTGFDYSPDAVHPK